MLSQSFYQFLFHRTAANLKAEVSRYYLNYLWWILEPLLLMAVFYVIFGIFLNRGTEHFEAFLLTGLVTWNWFSRTVSHAAGSILAGRGLMLQINISKVFFPLEVFLQDGFKATFAFILLLVFLFLHPIPVTATWVALPVLFVVQAFLVLSIAILAAALVPFVPDLKFIISTFLLMMFFGSGIFFDIESVVLEKHRALIYANPMAGLIKNYREILLYGHWPDWAYLAKIFILDIVALFVAIKIVRHFDYTYPRVCQ